MNKTTEKDYIIISKEDFEEIYRLINKIELDETKADSNIRCVHGRLYRLYDYIKNNKLKGWILKHIFRIDLEKEFREVDKYLVEALTQYLFICHTPDLWIVKKRLEKLKNENGLNKPHDEPKDE